MKIGKYKRMLLLLSFLVLAGCATKDEVVTFEEETEDVFFELVDEIKHDEINFSKELELNQEFDVEYKTFEPDGSGKAFFKAKSIREIEQAGGVEASEGKKLVLVEIAVKGDSKNQGRPSTFNQIGDYPSPQFVMIDKEANSSLVEDTYFSDSYTQDNKLFELSKITMDQNQWINTAIVFEIDNDRKADIAFMFTNLEGKTEFYDITQD